MPFDAYAAYYNLLYKDKDYYKEAAYIHELITANSIGAKSLLDAGCGTGKHAVCFHKMGYKVTGVDISEKMITIAQSTVQADEIRFVQGDIRSIRLNKIVDVVVSLFHVISYQQSLQELVEAFETATAHLSKGGLFIFDCWYGPGVTSDPPKHITKSMCDDSVSIHRVTTPSLYSKTNQVNVHFKVEVCDKLTSANYTIQEDHLMRYWFTNEIQEAANQTSFNILKQYKWMTYDNLESLKPWYAVFVLEKM